LVKRCSGQPEDQQVQTHYRRSGSRSLVLAGVGVPLVLAFMFAPLVPDGAPPDSTTRVFLVVFTLIVVGTGASLVAIGLFSGITVRDQTVSITPVVHRRTVPRDAVTAVEVWPRSGPTSLFGSTPSLRAGLQVGQQVVQAWPYLSGHRHLPWRSYCVTCLEDKATMARLAAQLGVPFYDKS